MFNKRDPDIDPIFKAWKCHDILISLLQMIHTHAPVNSLSFKTRNNKKNNLTEFYNLIYQYKTDCLVASIRYNKEYYSSNTKKPNEELFFNITLIPLGSTQTESIID